MTARALGFDTSNYTTSAAVFDGTEAFGLARLLEVAPGALGLRQQEALFQHVGRLPALMETLAAQGRLSGIAAVAAATRPRAVEGSYMPCFFAGESAGRTVAATLSVPFYAVSHQQGHLAAAAYGAGVPSLLDAPFLAWHLSGGTTELLHVTPENGTVCAARIGGTTDLAAGQLIDRTGLRLGLDFPAGAALDALAAASVKDNYFTVKTDECSFSLSGVENQIAARLADGEPPAAVARFALLTLADVVARATAAALICHPGLPVLCSGGVASNALLRKRLPDAHFAPPDWSADNARGVAILAHRLRERGVRT